MKRLGVALLVLLVVGLGLKVATVHADHLIYLPLVPRTPLMQQVINTQTYNWCADSRAASYPDFMRELRDEAVEYEARVGIKAREVAYGDAACQVSHVMPDSFSCGSGAAACIYYANSFPVRIEYNYRLGYVDWRTAQGHELGHGLLGLNEQYHDQGGNIGCTGKQWTVMDCGSGVRYPQDWDVNNGCAVIKTVWCGNPKPLPEYGACNSNDHGTWCFNNFDGLWHWTVWLPTYSQEWRSFAGGPWYCADGCP